MKDFSIFFILVALTFSQVITVNIVINESVIDSIEHQLINDIFELWNRKSDKEIKYKWRKHKQFSDFMKYMENLSNDEKDNEMALSSITITKQRLEKYRFSIPYVPIREVMICMKSTNIDQGQKSIENKKVGANLGTTQEHSLKHLLNKIQFEPFYFSINEFKYNALINGEIDFYIDDNVNVWSDSRLKIVFEVEKQSGDGYGIMYHKESKLKKKIDPILMYYIKSAKFRKITSEKFGKKISDYFVKKLSVE
jgi:hypothetical protein